MAITITLQYKIECEKDLSNWSTKNFNLMVQAFTVIKQVLYIVHYNHIASKAQTII